MQLILDADTIYCLSIVKNHLISFHEEVIYLLFKGLIKGD
jgi:hypothetical protein